MIKSCPKCGKVNNGWKFCPECGTELKEKEELTFEERPHQWAEKEKQKRILRDQDRAQTQHYLEDFLKMTDQDSNHSADTKDDLSAFEYTKHSDGTVTITGVKNENISEIVIPDNVVKIGDGAFLCCTNLKSVTIGSKVTSIGGWAFDGCRSLTTINIPNSVKVIGVHAFTGCDSLTTINIPDSVTSIELWAFEGSGLKTLYIGRNNALSEDDFKIFGTIPSSCQIIRK